MARPYATPSTQLGTLIDQGLRNYAAFDQAALAEICGVNKSYLSKLKLGRIRSPRESVLVRLAAMLHQDIDDYRVALLADSGELPRWEKVLDSQLAHEEGVRLSREDAESIERYARALIRQRRGKE